MITASQYWARKGVDVFQPVYCFILLSYLATLPFQTGADFIRILHFGMRCHPWTLSPALLNHSEPYPKITLFVLPFTALCFIGIHDTWLPWGHRFEPLSANAPLSSLLICLLGALESPLQFEG